MLTWNVYIGNINSKEIEMFNIFDHWKFTEDCQENLKENGGSRERFVEQLRRDLMYYFWSKCEWEVIVSHWPPNERCRYRKIDVCDQVLLNWTHFVDYVWENRKELLNG